MIGLLITAVWFPFIGVAVSRVVGRVPPFLGGVAVGGIALFLAAVVGISPTIAIVVLGATALIVIVVRGKPAKQKVPIDYPRLLTLTIVIPIAFMLVVTAITPQHDYDGTFWMLKAKAIATERAIDGRFFKGEGTYNPRNEYPLLVPLNAAAVMIMSLEADERHVRWLSPLILAGLAFEIRRRFATWFTPSIGAACAAILVWLPQFAVESEGGAMSAYADVALAAFAACAFFEIVDAGSPHRLGIWLAAMVLTKNEGLPYALVLLAASAIVFRARAGIAAVTPALATVALLVWRIGIAPTDEGDPVGRVVLLPQYAGRIDEALAGIGSYMLAWRDWGVLWAAAAAALAIALWRREWRAVTLPLAATVPMILLYVVIYAVTDWEIGELMKVSTPRLLMHLTAPALYLLATGFSVRDQEVQSIEGRKRHFSRSRSERVERGSYAQPDR